MSSYYFILLLLLCVCATTAQATHLRGGEITAMRDNSTNPNPRRFIFKLVIYTDRSAPADDITITIHHGDGATVVLPRGPVMQISPETNQETFMWEHTFPADGTYTVSWLGVNRHGRILNMAAPSDAHSLYLATTMNINTFRGFNSTPVLLMPPIDVGNVGSVYVHNPVAFDADGDSLAFRLVTPRRQAPNSTNIINLPGYTLPHNTFSCANSTGTVPASFTLDAVTGQMVWDAPCRAGEYTVAFVVEEWRKSQGGMVKIGEVLRDMQITIKGSSNRPPALSLSPKDTCIVAGTTLTGFVRATDPDGDSMHLTAVGGMLPPALFQPSASNSNTSGLATGTFSWTPTCADVRAQPYQVVFRAEDRRPLLAERLVDLQPWNIRVVAPPPQQLAVARQGSSIQVSWGSYDCPGATIRIYRHAGAGSFVPENCTPGIPASSGFVLVGEAPAEAAFFLDTNSGNGLTPLRQYCYQLVAVLPSPGNVPSMTSIAVCANAMTKDELERSVQVFPNPLKDIMQVEIPDNFKWEKVSLYNTTGALIFEILNNGQTNLNLKLPKTEPGLHLLQLLTKDGMVTKRVLLK